MHPSIQSTLEYLRVTYPQISGYAPEYITVRYTPYIEYQVRHNGTVKYAMPEADATTVP